MFSNRLYSPLRYPGGKVRFASFITQVMLDNGLEGAHYCEPYAGGAAVALDLLFSGVASHVHINDLDDAVHSFWLAALSHPEDLLRLVRDTPLTMEEWHRWRRVMIDPRVDATPAERGFATLFMNRTNRSGILKAGVIGGQRQEGAYKLDARFNKTALAERIDRIARHASKISLYQQDAARFLRSANSLLPRKSLTYLDPPYYVKGQGLYRNYYEQRDHENIARLLQSTRFTRPWVVSYDDSPEIRRLYEASRCFQYDLYYSAQVKHFGCEVMFFSHRLSAPSPELLPRAGSTSLTSGCNPG